MYFVTFQQFLGRIVLTAACGLVRSQEMWKMLQRITKSLQIKQKIQGLFFLQVNKPVSGNENEH